MPAMRHRGRVPSSGAEGGTGVLGLREQRQVRDGAVRPASFSGRTNTVMRIDVELDGDETALLLMMLGAGTASLTSLSEIDNMLVIVNKLMKDNPSFIPYDVTPKKRVR